MAAFERVTPRTIHELDELRLVWGVSQSSLVKRAYDRGLFGERRYRSLFRLLNDSGRLYGQRPGLDAEQPQLMSRFVDGLASAGYEAAEIARVLLQQDPRSAPTTTPARHLSLA